MISSIPSDLSLSDPLLIPAVTCAGVIATEALEAKAVGVGVVVIAMGITSTGVRYKCTHGRFLLENGGVLW